MPNYNRAVLMGHLTRDVELRALANDNHVGKFGLAVNTKRKAGDEVLFIEATIWGRQAQNLHEFVGKGDPLLCEGRLILNRWEDKEGKEQKRVELIVERFQLVAPKPPGLTPSRRSSSSADDGVPF